MNNWFSEFVNHPETIRKCATSEASRGTNSLKEINKNEYKIRPRILFDQLKKELPDSIWVIVIDGVFNAFGLNIYI